MPQITIELSPEQHQRLKDFASMQGLSIEDYVLQQSLSSNIDEYLSEEEALAQLEDYLKPRIEAAERGEFSTKTFEQIIKEAL